MGWMSNIAVDVEELNEKMLDIYSDEEIVKPWDAVEPLSEYLMSTGWRSPTEMLAYRSQIVGKMRAIKHASTVSGQESADARTARGDLVIHIMEVFKIDITDVLPSASMANSV